MDALLSLVILIEMNTPWETMHKIILMIKVMLSRKEIDELYGQ